MTDAKEDIYVHLLRIAKAELTERPGGISYDEFIARIRASPLKQHPETLWRKIYDPGGQNHSHMGFDAYMSLLEYEELKHALEESKQARKDSLVALKYARLAIYISIGIAVASIAAQFVLWLIDRLCPA